MREYIEAGKVADFHDHHYPSEMSVDALIQTFLMDESDEAVETFLKRFDSEWERYNRDLIRKVKEYYKVDDLTLENIALARNWILKGSEPDIERTAIYVLKDFREGRLGLFILDDLPQD